MNADGSLNEKFSDSPTRPTDAAVFFLAFFPALWYTVKKQ